MTRSRLLASGASSLILFLAAAAEAQTAPSTPADVTGPAAAAQSTAPADDGDVVVTARRQNERIQDVPLTINAQTSAMLLEHNITDLQGVARYTPGLQFKDYVTSFNGSATLRGQTQTNVQNAVGNVGTFIDGIYLQRGYLVNTSIGDWDRIEVVKGPQSALYGANTFSGAINYVTRQPTDTLKVDGLVSVGSAGIRQASAGIGGPIIEGILSARVYVARQQGDGTWRNNLPGIAGRYAHFGAYDRDGFSGALRFTPTSQLAASVYYSEVYRTEYLRPYYTVLGTFVENKTNCGRLNATTGRPSQFCGTYPVDPSPLLSGVGNRPKGLFAAQEPPAKQQTKLLRATLDYKFTDALSAHYLFGHVVGQAQEDFSFASNTFNPTGLATISQQHEGGIIAYDSHEARLAYDGQSVFKGDIGYFHSQTRDRFTFGTKATAPGAVLIRTNDDPLSLSGISPFTNTDARYKVDAIFARASVGFLDDRARLSAEGRYSWTRIAFNDILARTTVPTRPLLTSDYNDFVPRVTAEYHVSRDNMLYASAAKGIKAGGFNGYVSGTTTLTTAEQSFGEESNWTYEIGSKNSFLNNRVIVNVAAFYIDWSNKQAAVTPSGYNLANLGVGVTPPSIYQTSASARTLGVEVDGRVVLARQLSLTYSANYTNAKYRNGSIAVNYIGPCDGITCPLSGAIGGNYIEGAPSFSGSAGFAWRDHLKGEWDWFAGIDGTFQNRQYVDSVNLVKIAGYTLFDGRIGVDNGKWKLFAWGRNMFDKKYIQNSFLTISLRQYAPSFGERGTYGATAAVSF